MLSAFALLVAFTLNAQDEKKSEIHVTIQKDGKTLKDTVYMVEDEKSVEHASKILDMTFGDPKEGEKHKVMTFISEDGKTYEFQTGDSEAKYIHKMHSGNKSKGEEHEMIMEMIHESDDDAHVFVTTEEDEDGETTVIVKKIKMGKEGDIHKMMSEEGMSEEEHEMIKKMIHDIDSDDDSQVFVTKEKGENGETKLTVKKIKICDDGEESIQHKEENVIIMKAGEKGELKKFQHNGEEPVWIEKDGAKILIIDSDDGMKKKIMVVTDSDSDQKFTTEDGETIIIKTTKDGENEKEVNVEVIVDEDKAAVVNEKKKDKKAKK